MSRSGAFLVTLLFVAAHAAADRTALIFIRPDAAGPHADIHTYVHPNWVLWPAPVGDEGLNRLLSVASGIDLLGEPGDTEFRQTGEGKPWTATAISSLKTRGFFRARSDSIGEIHPIAIETAGMTVSHAALVVALDFDGRAHTAPFKADIIENECAIYSATGWDDAVALSYKVDRTIVVEYSPQAGNDRWTRMWLFGHWPDGLPDEMGVPGLIHASSVLKLLARPRKFVWTATKRSWAGANRWLEFVRVAGVETQAAIGALALIVLALSVSTLSRERRSNIVMGALRAILLLPSAVLLAGNVAYGLGLQAWWPAIICILSLEFVLSWFFTRLLRRYEVHDLFGIAAISLFATMATNPLWSFYSPILGHLELPYSPQWVGVFSASVAATMAYGREIKFQFLLIPILAAMASAWFLSQQRDFVTVVLECAAVILGCNLLSGRILLLAAFLSSDLLKLQHWAWTPAGLFHDYGQRGAIDLARHVLFFASLGFVSLCMTLAMASAMADKFFWHEARAAFKRDQNRALFWLSGFAAVQGIANPEMLTAAYYIVFAAILAFLYDCLRAV